MTIEHEISICNNCHEAYSGYLDNCPKLSCQDTTQSRENIAKRVVRHKPSANVYHEAPTRLKKRPPKNWGYLGLLFDSKDEAIRYGYLKDKQASGVIRHLTVQPTMTIRDEFQLNNPFYLHRKDGTPRQIASEVYTPDYAYIYGNLMIIEDVKGISRGKPYSKGDSTRSQKHLMRRYNDKHHVVFMLVTQSRHNGWDYWQQTKGYPQLDFRLVGGQQ